MENYSEKLTSKPPSTPYAGASTPPTSSSPTSKPSNSTESAHATSSNNTNAPTPNSSPLYLSPKPTSTQSLPMAQSPSSTMPLLSYSLLYS